MRWIRPFRQIVAAAVLGAASPLFAGVVIRPSGVPEALVAFSGERIGTASAWERTRKPELRRYFLENMYGVRPPAAEKPDVSFVSIVPDKIMLEGKALRKRIRIEYCGPYGRDAFPVTAFIPNSDRKVPVFLLICNRKPAENLDPERKVKSEFWPVEEIVARGYAAVAFYTCDVAAETYNPATAHLGKVFGCYERPQDRTDKSWGTLSAWAWGASRAMDWIETVESLDAGHVAVVGHSRGGKAALLAGVTDGRFALTCVNCSGCGGTKLASIELPKSEFYASFAASRVDYWFCGGFQAHFVNRDRRVAGVDALPWHSAARQLEVDQHELLALIAPRLLAVASATEDDWAGQLGEFHASRLASPVWKLYGLDGLVAPIDPPQENDRPRGGLTYQDGFISYHVRSGKHTLASYDWQRYMDFADRHRWRK